MSKFNRKRRTVIGGLSALGLACVAADARGEESSGAAANAPVRARKVRREAGDGPCSGRGVCTTVAPGEWGVGRLCALCAVLAFTQLSGKFPISSSRHK